MQAAFPYSILFVFWSALIVQGCQQETITPQPEVDTRLQAYFESFQTEAMLRGMIIDFHENPVEGLITTIEDSEVSGQCRYSSQNPNTVTIDLDYWNAATGIQREFIIFHELGHCVLDRGHLDTEGTSRRCASIMHSGTSGCINAYSPVTRSDYLDELFIN